MGASPPRAIRLVPLTALDTESQLRVRDIRNEENVRRWMYTDHVIGVNEHLAWIHRLKQDDGQIVFVVLSETSEPMGVVSVGPIDSLHKKADWAYYLTEGARGGLGSALEYCFIDFVFSELGLEKLNCEVIEGNDAVVKLHRKFLFQEEGFRRSNISKNGVRTGVHLLGLTKDEWLAGREEIRARHGGVFEKFSVSVEWQFSQEVARHAIDQIESARAKNNLNWMSILRLALEKSPDTAKPIVAEIKRIDQEISALTGKIFESGG